MALLRMRLLIGLASVAAILPQVATVAAALRETARY